MSKSLGFKLLVGLLLAIIPTSSIAQMTKPILGENETGLRIVESHYNTGDSISRVGTRISGGSYSLLCDSQTFKPCSTNDALFANVILPPCETAASEWCIDALHVGSSQQAENLNKAELIGTVDAPVINSISSIALPKGGNVSLWKSNTIANDGSAATYAIHAMIKGVKPEGAAKFNFSDLNVQVLPYKEIAGNYYTPTLHQLVNVIGKPSIEMRGGAYECAWVSTGKCGLVENFTIGTRVRVGLRLGKSLSGWLVGRLESPEIKIGTLATGQNSLVVESDVATIPKFQKKLKISNVGADLRAKARGTLQSGWTIQVARYGLADFSLWSKYVDDYASDLERVWSFGTISHGNGSQCLQNSNRLLGIVSTNAMVYESNAPSLIEGELQYKVAGLHYNPDGTEFLGIYELLIRSETARCIYGFSEAPISATISVISEEGSPKTAITTLSEKDGWLRLSASGFTFSNPTIKVKLIQKNQNPVICTKGSLTKQLKGKSSKCPIGYKKK